MGVRTLLGVKHLLTLTVTTQAHAHESQAFAVMDVQDAEAPCKGIFSPCITGTWAEVKFRMFGYVLIPRLKPIPLPWFVNYLLYQAIP